LLLENILLISSGPGNRSGILPFSSPGLVLSESLCSFRATYFRIELKSIFILELLSDMCDDKVGFLAEKGARFPLPCKLSSQRETSESYSWTVGNFLADPS